MSTIKISRSSLSALALVAFGLMAMGSKSSDKKASAASGDGGETATSAATGAGAVLGTCMKKAAGKCTESYGKVATMVPDLCQGEGGTFTRGSTPCPTEGLVGKCMFRGKSPGAPSEASFYYAAAPGDPKASCEKLGAEWTAAPGAPPSAAGGKAAPVVVAPEAKAFFDSLGKSKQSAAAFKKAAKPGVKDGDLSTYDFNNGVEVVSSKPDGKATCYEIHNKVPIGYHAYDVCFEGSKIVKSTYIGLK